VVWEEARAGDTDIYGARVTADGALLDGAGIAISTAPGDQHSPTVVWDGASWLVVWEDYDGCGDLSCSDLYGARVGPGGELLPPGEIAISTAFGGQFGPVAVPGAGGS